MFTQLELGAALEAIHDPVIIAEREDLRIIYVNHAFSKLTGYHPAEVPGWLLSDIYLPVDADLPATSDQFANGATSRRHGLLRTCTNERVAVEVRASLATMAGQERLVCVCREVQSALDPAAEFARWSALEHYSFGTVPLSIYTFNQRGQITQFNHTGPFQTHFPDQTTAIVGNDLFSTQIIALNDHLIPPLRQVLDGVPFERVVSQFRLPEGELINVRIFGMPLSDPTGTSDGGLLVVEDLTHHAHLARQFTAAEHRYQALLQAVPDLLLLVGSDGTYLDCKVSEMGTLVPPEDFIGKNVTEIGPPGLGDRILSLIQHVIVTGELEVLVYELPFEGELRTYEARLVPNLPNEVLVVVRDITEQKRNEDAVCRQSQLLEGIARASIRLLSGGDFETALHEALVLIGEATGAQFVHVGECSVDPTTQRPILTLRHWWSPEKLRSYFDNHDFQPVRWGTTSGTGNSILRQGDIVNRIASEIPERTRNMFEPLQMQSMVIAPIFVRGGFWGIIGFDDFEQARRWRPEELTLIQAMATGLGTAIERQEAEDRLRHEREIADTMVEAGTILSSTLDCNEVLARLLEQVGRIVPYDAANVMLVEQGTMRIARSRGYEAFGLTEQTISQHKFQMNATPILKKMAETKEPYLCGDVWRDPDWIRALGNDATPRSWLGVPILVYGEMVGLFSLDSMTPDFYREDHVRLVMPFARQAAIAYENAQLYAQVKTQARELAERYQEIKALYWAGQAILSSLEPKEILLRLAQQIAQLTNSTTTIICDYDPAAMSGEVQAVAHRANAARPATDTERMSPIHLDSPALQSMATNGQSHLFVGPDIEHTFLDCTWLVGMQTVMVLPLFSKGRTAGCVIVADERSQTSRPEGELWQCQMLTQQAAMMLKQATLFAEIQDLERTKSEMIRMASHDLRVPLQRAQGFMELLDGQIHSTLSQKQNDYVTFILNALAEIAQITKDVLSLERIEQRHRASQPVNWHQLLTDVITSLAPEVDARHQHLNADFSPDLPVMRGDSVQLARAVGNLISNAIKYTPEGGGIIVRAFVSTAASHLHINIEVEDTGSGIPTEKQAQLFQPFYRAQHEGTKNISGSGLGLSIVKAAVEYHRGTVYFTSQPGHGSTFGFRLPL